MLSRQHAPSPQQSPVDISEPKENFMNSAPRARVRLTRQSLQVRLTVLTMSICLFSLWGLAGYLLQHVNEHISESLSAQQHDVVQLHGNAINAELALRLQSCRARHRTVQCQVDG
jgi:hypothetical protein